VAYATAFYQKGGLLTLFAREHLNRAVGSWEIPVTWFLVISTLTFIFISPLATRLWQAMDRRGSNPASSTKLAWGLIAIGFGYLVLYFASSNAGEGGHVWWPWLVITYVFFGIGDVLVWPTQISMVTRLAPIGYAALFVGAWYVTIGIGSWLTGYVGALAYRWSMATFFLVLAGSLFVLGAMLWTLTSRMLVWTRSAN
jgi:POT family proton-dependent oligopeptide transporter